MWEHVRDCLLRSLYPVKARSTRLREFWTHLSREQGDWDSSLSYRSYRRGSYRDDVSWLRSSLDRDLCGMISHPRPYQCRSWCCPSREERNTCEVPLLVDRLTGFGSILWCRWQCCFSLFEYPEIQRGWRGDCWKKRRFIAHLKMWQFPYGNGHKIKHPFFSNDKRPHKWMCERLCSNFGSMIWKLLRCVWFEFLQHRFVLRIDGNRKSGHITQKTILNRK